MENSKTNEGELTSTMGSLLSTSKDEKNDSSDSTPTSSTDAFTTTSISQIAADDPISSTSCDVLESKKNTDKVNNVAHSSMNVMSSLKDMSVRGHSSPIGSEKDLLDMNITDTSTEKITENVDDIVQDLENLLGEPTTTFDFTVRPKSSKNVSTMSQKKDISIELDDFSAELQMFGEQSTESKEVPADISINQIIIDDSVNKNEPNVEDISNKAIENTVTEVAENTLIQEKIESSQSVNENSELLMDISDIKKDTIEKLSNEQIENCQFEIISASSVNSELISIEKSELLETQGVTSETQDVTSTYCKTEISEEVSDLKSEDTVVVKEQEKQYVEESEIDLHHFEAIEEVPDDVTKVLTSSADVVAILENQEKVELTSSSEVVDSAQVEENKDENLPVEATSGEIIENAPPTEEQKIQECMTNEVAPEKMEVEEDSHRKEECEIILSVEKVSLLTSNVSENVTELKGPIIIQELKPAIAVIEELKPIVSATKKLELTATVTEEPEPIATESQEERGEVSSVPVIEIISPVTEEKMQKSEERILQSLIESTKTVEFEPATKSEGVVLNIEESAKVDESEDIAESSKHMKSEEVDNINISNVNEFSAIVTESDEIVEMFDDKLEETNGILNSDNGEDGELKKITEVNSAVTEDEDKQEENVNVLETETMFSGENEEKREEEIELLVIPEASDEIQSTVEEADAQNAMDDCDVKSSAAQPSTQNKNIKQISETEPKQHREEIDEKIEERQQQCQEIEEGSAKWKQQPHEEIAETQEKQEQPCEVIEKNIEKLEQQSCEEIEEKVEKLKQQSCEEIDEKVEKLEQQSSEELEGKEEKLEQQHEKDDFLVGTESVVVKDLEKEQRYVDIAIEQTEALGAEELQTFQIFEQNKNDHEQEIPDVVIEQSKAEELVEVLAIETFSDERNIDVDYEDVPVVASVDFIPESIEKQSHSLAEDLDLLVRSTVNDETIPNLSLTHFEDKVDKNNSKALRSSGSTLKDIEEGSIENNVLSLAMEDVPNLDVLNAISTLSDNTSNLIPEMAQDIPENDALLTCSSLEQPSVNDVAFEPSLPTGLPTVDEIFAEQNQQSQEELQDDNLETLLAVANLQNVDDFASSVDEVSNFVAEESNAAEQEFSPMFAAVVESPQIPEESIEFLLIEKEASGDDKKAIDETVKEVVLEPTREVTQQQSKLKEPLVVEFSLAEKGSLSDDKKVINETIKEEVLEPTRELKQQQSKLKEPLVINVDNTEKERIYSPKITIKPIKPPEEEAVGSSESESKGSLKMTITKQSDNTHSILKIYNPDDETSHSHEDQEPSVPKLIIKPIVQANEQPQSPKISTRSSKVFSPSSSNQRSASPRITIKPIPRPEEAVAPLKITIKSVLKPDESHKQKHSPKLTIKPILKPEEENVEPKVHSPRVTIKPIMKPPEEIEQVLSPRITIKPIVKPIENISESISITPRVTIKPVVKPSEKEKGLEMVEQVERSSPKITIKPIVKPQEPEPPPCEDFEESIKERIVLKINKGTIPGSSKESRKRDAHAEEEKSEKLAKIKLKFSKEGGHPQIVQDQSPTKRSSEQFDHERSKRQRIDTEQFLPGITITPIGPSTHSKLKEMLSRSDFSSSRVLTIDDDDDDVTIVEEPNKSSPIVISEESNQDGTNAPVDVRDPISEIPVFEITPDCVKTLNPQPVAPVVEVPAMLPAPRKRGRPRKVPLQVREDFKDPKEEEPKPVIVESTRPKRSCRGQSVRTTLGIKPRKPRGGGRGRGSKRGMGTRSTSSPLETPPKAAKEPKLSGAKLKELKEESFLLSDKSEVKTIEIDDGPQNSLLAPPQSDTSTTDRADIVMYEEETRMSAETGSRAQTPAKQVVTTIPTVDLVEESQSSVQSIQSTATTESVKVRKGPRLEVHQEPEGAVISADQLAEYYWMGGGPYMLQEQVAQFLGIKSFKRKYPNIARRVVDMQERDFIRESGLAGEAMCDLGLTAVNSSDILDIMYSDFQDKYEEYCKHQRDRQAKDLINKQKALSLAASQEKAKMDITQQAVQSAASWNATFNKTRRDQRKSCMDLQTLTIHFPKGKMKQINKPKIGYYPVALVPGQYTDYYREFTPTEINNLPINTMCYEPVVRGVHHEMDCESQTDGSGSESDSSTSDSDSSYSGSSDAEDCTLCKHTPKRIAAAQ